MADVGAILFLVFVFILIVLLMYVFMKLDSDGFECLSDPGGREQFIKDKKNKKKKSRKKSFGFDEEYSSMDEEEGRFHRTPSPGKKGGGGPGVELPRVYSAYGDMGAVDQSVFTEHGRVRFDVGYSRQKLYTKVRILDYVQLPADEEGQTSSYRIQLTLLPNKEQQFKTKPMTSPTINETFVFKNISQNDLAKSAVYFELLGHSKETSPQQKHQKQQKQHDDDVTVLGETFFELATFVKMKSPVFQGISRSFQLPD